MIYFKKLLKSKMVWLGIVQVVTGLGLFFTGEQTSTELFLGTNGIITIILRMLTTNSIDHK